MKIATAAVYGVCAWTAGPFGVVAIVALLGTSALLCRRSLVGRSAPWASAILFPIMWAAIKFGLDLWDGAPPVDAAASGLLLAGRLTAVLLLGLALTALASPRELGAALTWALRPLLGSRAWKVALALSLMIHFLPQTGNAARDIRDAMQLRCPDMSLRRKSTYFAGALLRAMSWKTVACSTAFAARGMDEPEAWRPRFSVGLTQTAVASAVAATGLGLAAL